VRRRRRSTTITTANGTSRRSAIALYATSPAAITPIAIRAMVVLRGRADVREGSGASIAV